MSTVKVKTIGKKKDGRGTFRENREGSPGSLPPGIVIIRHSKYSLPGRRGVGGGGVGVGLVLLHGYSRARPMSTRSSFLRISLVDIIAYYQKLAKTRISFNFNTKRKIMKLQINYKKGKPQHIVVARYPLLIPRSLNICSSYVSWYSKSLLGSWPPILSAIARYL